MTNRRDTLLLLAAGTASLSTGTTALARTAGEAGRPGVAGNGGPRDVRSFPGIKADGKTDDFAALQAAFVAARDSGSGIFWPAGVVTFVQFTQDRPHMFIDGPVHLRGGDANSSGIAFHCNYEMTGHAPLFCWGIPSKGAQVRKVKGEVSNLGWFLRPGSNKFERCCAVYGAEDFTVQDNFADFRAVTWPAADEAHKHGWQAGGWWSSNGQPKFATGQTRDRNIRFLRNKGFARAEYQNAESIGFTNVDGLQYIDNVLTGWADDMAAHWCTDVTMQGNVYRAVAGRLYLEGCQHVRIIRNVVEAVERPIVGGYLGPIRRYIHANMVIDALPVGQGAPATEMPNSDIVISDNTIGLLRGSYCTGAIAAWGVQDNLTISGNRVINRGAHSPVTMIAVSTGQREGWTGPAGNPDANSGGVVRMRNVVIRDNIADGEGWQPEDGTIGVVTAKGGPPDQVVGPVVVEGNRAGHYYIPVRTVRFGRNESLPTSKNAFRDVNREAMANGGSNR